MARVALCERPAPTSHIRIQPMIFYARNKKFNVFFPVLLHRGPCTSTCTLCVQAAGCAEICESRRSYYFVGAVAVFACRYPRYCIWPKKNVLLFILVLGREMSFGCSSNMDENKEKVLHFIYTERTRIHHMPKVSCKKYV